MHSTIQPPVTTESAPETHARIDLSAITENASALVSAAGGTPVMAVVKANGYGHGLVPAARAALAGGAHRLGVNQVDEALELRRANVTAPVLAWLPWRQGDFEAAVPADVEIGVDTPWRLDLAAAAGARHGQPARIHLEVDTGMSRGGATRDDWPQLVEAARRAQAAGHVTVTGIFSHFACADAPGDPSIAGQLGQFDDAVRYAAGSGVEPEMRHIANSAALFSLPESRYDLVRTGMALYGLDPFDGTVGPTVRPAMSLRSAVVVVKRIRAGAGVMYGLTYRAEKDTTVAVVPVGYVDGLTRAAGTAGVEPLVGGRPRPIAGVVGMEETVIDVGDDMPSIGDEVILFGPGDDGEPTVVDLARRTGTVPAEIVSRVPASLPRIYRS